MPPLLAAAAAPSYVVARLQERQRAAALFRAAALSRCLRYMVIDEGRWRAEHVREVYCFSAAGESALISGAASTLSTERIQRQRACLLFCEELRWRHIQEAAAACR